MKKMTFAVLALTLICFSVIIGCKKTEQPAPEQEQAQPAEEPAPAEESN